MDPQGALIYRFPAGKIIPPTVCTAILYNSRFYPNWATALLAIVFICQTHGSRTRISRDCIVDVLNFPTHMSKQVLNHSGYRGASNIMQKDDKVVSWLRHLFLILACKQLEDLPTFQHWCWHQVLQNLRVVYFGNQNHHRHPVIILIAECRHPMN